MTHCSLVIRVLFTLQVAVLSTVIAAQDIAGTNSAEYKFFENKVRRLTVNILLSMRKFLLRKVRVSLFLSAFSVSMM